MAEGKTDPPSERTTMDDAARATVVEDVSTGDRTTLDDAPAADASATEGAPESGAGGGAELSENPDDPENHATMVDAAPAKKPRATIYLVVGALLFIALAGPLVAYFLIFQYQPTAVKHVPARTNMAIGIDSKQPHLYKPFRAKSH